MNTTLTAVLILIAITAAPVVLVSVLGLWLGLVCGLLANGVIAAIGGSQISAAQRKEID